MPARHVEDHKWWTLTAVCVATFMLLIDITIVNVALPDIAKALHSSFTDLQWVIDAYALSLAALLLTFGLDLRPPRAPLHLRRRPGDLHHRLAGLRPVDQPDDAQPRAWRAGRRRRRRCSPPRWRSWPRPSTAASAGPRWGSGARPSARPSPSARWSAALLTETIGWESIFYVNVPIGIAAIYISLTRVAESKDPNAGPNDWLGLVTFSGGLFLLIFALVRGNAEGWSSTLIVSFLVGAVVLLVLFVVVEARIEHPMFDLTLFRKPTFGGACIAAFALSASMFSMFLYLTLYIQNVAGLLAAGGGRALPAALAAVVPRRADRGPAVRARADPRRSSGAACCSSPSR